MIQRKKIVAGNWKMHGSRALVQKMIETLSPHAREVKNLMDIALFPPAIYIPLMVEQIKSSNLSYGAQDVAEYKQGAYTGEISAAMLVEFNCDYVIVGHSERRSLYHETSKIVARKFAMAQTYQITPILCVGETLEQREAGQAMEVIREQINAILELPTGINVLSHAVIAYEPVWAIGTGKTATPEQAQEIHQNIRDYLSAFDPTIAQALRILYGGSVKPDNAALLSIMPDIDGFLVGGASLDPQQFLAICQQA